MSKKRPCIEHSWACADSLVTFRRNRKPFCKIQACSRAHVCFWRKADKGFGNWKKDRKRTNCVGQRNHVFSSVLLVDFHRKVGSDVAGLAAEWQVRYNQRAANPKTLRNAIANFLCDLDTLERLGRT